MLARLLLDVNELYYCVIISPRPTWKMTTRADSAVTLARISSSPSLPPFLSSLEPLTWKSLAPAARCKLPMSQYRFWTARLSEGKLKTGYPALLQSRSCMGSRALHTASLLEYLERNLVCGRLHAVRHTPRVCFLAARSFPQHVHKVAVHLHVRSEILLATSMHKSATKRQKDTRHFLRPEGVKRLNIRRALFRATTTAPCWLPAARRVYFFPPHRAPLSPDGLVEPDRGLWPVP